MFSWKITTTCLIGVRVGKSSFSAYTGAAGKSVIAAAAIRANALEKRGCIEILSLKYAVRHNAGERFCRRRHLLCASWRPHPRPSSRLCPLLADEWLVKTDGTTGEAV